jgi:hypothetical protein
LDRAEWLYQYWLEQAGLFSDGEKLGNVAAIHRWETATMERSLERVVPPAALSEAHERVLDALDIASRAAQLLSSGSRFHNANALCEGWSLLDTSRERRLAALRTMRRYMTPLAAMQQSQEAPMASALAPTAVAEAPLATADTPPAATPDMPPAAADMPSANAAAPTETLPGSPPVVASHDPSTPPGRAPSDDPSVQ